jgi:hypothetical protein
LGLSTRWSLSKIHIVRVNVTQCDDGYFEDCFLHSSHGWRSSAP